MAALAVKWTRPKVEVSQPDVANLPGAAHRPKPQSQIHSKMHPNNTFLPSQVRVAVLRRGNLRVPPHQIALRPHEVQVVGGVWRLVIVPGRAAFFIFLFLRILQDCGAGGLEVGVV